MTLSEREQAWTRYWRSGALHSCAGSYAGNYGGAVAAFWRARFTGLDASLRVLDLATGNGPLPALLHATVATADLPTVDAVDLAEPRPPWLGSLAPAVAARIRFHAGVRVELLPFPDASFDRVVSQYGFEYAEPQAAATEALRVLAPRGEIALVCHRAGSRLHAVAAEEVAHLDWVLAHGSVVTALYGSLPAAAPSADFVSAMNRMVERAQRSAFPDALHDVAAVAREALRAAATHGADAARAALDGWVAAARDARLRSAELCEHALDADGLDALVARFAAGGLGVETGTLYEGEHSLGWTIVAH